MYEVETARFEEMVRQAVEELPDEFAAQLSNLEFAVEAAPRPSDFPGGRPLPGQTLLGVYRGVPHSRRGPGYGFALPDRIVIFQRPIEYIARDEDDLYRRVRRVVFHEIAHHFGISDERLREIDAY